MTDLVELRFESCSFSFHIEARDDGYVRYKIIATFDRLQASLPSVKRGWLSRHDIERLVARTDAWLEKSMDADVEPFLAYDSFFGLHFQESRTARMVLYYGPEDESQGLHSAGGVDPASLPSFSIRVGVEQSIAEEAVRGFRDGWVKQTELLS